MKFILMMNSPRDGYDQYMSWPKEILQANIAFMGEFTRKLRETGELLSTAGLASPVQAKRVRAGRDGNPITDGVFPESKEFLAGYWLVEVDSPERAYQIAAEASKAPGVGGGSLPDEFWIEVREVFSSHKDLE